MVHPLPLVLTTPFGLFDVVLMVGLIALVYLVFILWLWLIQDRLVFFPEPADGRTPGQLGLNFQELETTLRGGERIHGWHVPHPTGGDTLLFCHGNAGWLGDRLTTVRTYHEARLGVVIFDYPGFGHSTGHPSEASCHAATLAIYTLAIRELGIRPECLIPMGRSLGGAMAARLARTIGSKCLILESPFPTVRELAAHHYWYLPARWLAKDRFRTIDDLREYQGRTLILHSRSDTIVPFRMGEELSRVHPDRTELVEILGAHAEGQDGDPDYGAKVAGFLRDPT